LLGCKIAGALIEKAIERVGGAGDQGPVVGENLEAAGLPLVSWVRDTVWMEVDFEPFQNSSRDKPPWTRKLVLVVLWLSS
jgi:hypothetical protein